MITPQFDKVDGTSFTLGDITVCNLAGEELDDTQNADPALNKRCRNQIYVQKLKDGKLETGTVMQFTTGGYANREDPSKTFWKANHSVVIGSGEGLIVYNNNGVARTFRTAGAVKLTPITEIPLGFSIFGNNTPINYTIGDIQVCNLAGDELDDTQNADPALNKRCRNQIYVQKLKDGKLETGTVMQFTTGGYANREDPSKTFWKANHNVSFNAGEALIVYNNNGVARKFKLPTINVNQGGQQ